jgi:two-component system cell cycle sensor histidine kinase/response regulator CckA
VVNLVEQLERKPGAKTNALSNSPVGKIIVVDDELELKNILVEALSAQGFEVTSCNSGQQALEELRHKEFDLLLTDLMMPEMDGIALLEAAAMIDPHLIGIMMTGQGSIQTAVDAMKLGAFDYILKPFRMQSVMPVLTRAINTRRLRMENLQLRETVAIYGLCQTISFTLDPQTVLSRLADAALQQSDADEVSILLPTNDGKELYVAAVRGEKRERLLGERIPLQQSISSWVARERLPLILNGKVQDERFVALWPRADIRSAVSVPMQVANKLVGIINLNVINRLRPFTLGQMKALTILSSTAAAALESASLYAQLQTTEEKYRSIFENATEGLFQSTSDGRLLTANPALARILGYDSPEEMIATITDIAQQLYANPEDRAEAGRLQEERGALEGFELQAYRKDGEKFWLSLNRRSVRNQDGEELYFEGSIENISERKRAEEERAQLTAEIENQRQRLNNMVANVPGVVWEAWGQPDAETQRINFVSDYVETMLSYTVEEWLSTSNFWLTIVHPDDKEEAGRVAGEAFASGKSSSQEFRWITKDGRAIWVESNYVVIKDDEGRPAGLRGVTIDIAGRKRVEETQARRAAHALFRADVSATLAISRAPLRPTLESCVTAIVEHLGAAFARIWTLNREEEVLELQASSGMYTHIDGPHSRVPVGSLKIGKIAQERAPHITNEVQTDPRVSDKEWARREGMVAFAGYPLLVGNRLLGVMAMFSREELAEDTLDALASVTDLISQGIERKRAEEELRESEERYRLLFESNPQPMWVYDLDTLGFLAVNQSAVKHYGYSREEFLSMTIKDIRPSEDLPALYQAVSFRADGVETAGRWKHLKKDGTLIEVEITCHLLVFDGLQAELVLANDVTERNRLEAALLATEQQLRQSQKLEAIGQLAGGIAHDFNNLLTVIGGYSSILLNKLEQDSPFRVSVEEIKKASDRAAALTRQLLAFSRKQILQPKILDLNVVVSDLDRMVRRLIGEDIDLLAITDPKLGQVKADPGQLEQVLLNLIVNARDAMPSGGKLTIETANALLSPDYALSHGTPDGPYVMLAVSDTGCGMDTDLQKHVFEPFFTTKAPGKGTGLGLATVYGIVKQSDGHIWLYSEVEKGTCFKIYLPRVDEVVAGQVPTGGLRLAPKGTETLLLVEDEDQVRQIVKAILEQQGYDVLEAANGEEALKIAEAHGSRLHLLMTDLVMPQMSGRELAEQLSNTLPNLKVLYMSGYTDDAIVRHGLLDASLSFIQKPFDAATVARKVREVLDSQVP